MPPRRSQDRSRCIAAALALSWGFAASHAATHQVGPGQPFANLQAVAGLLGPGDVVEVQGNATYPGGVIFTRPGTVEQKITIRGIRVDGLRPRISGGTNTVTFATPDLDEVEESGSHYVFEGFELTGGSFRCLFHQAEDLTVRDVVVHDCPAHGILGADQGSGSLTLERVEVYQCGSGTTQHQIYMATDEVNRPGSVFRMRHCYVHDATGGNNVKSRAERNEIHYNWIEGAQFHELELIGPDPGGAPPGWSEGLVREDSDVVGNVLWKRNTFYVVRVGGDGTGQSNGRYRFVNNTVIPGTSAVFRIFDGIQSIEMHNNVFHRASGTVDLVRQVEADWTDGEQISGSGNWTTTGSLHVPAEWTGTLSAAQPGFADLGAGDLRPVPSSPLLDAAEPLPQNPPSFPLQGPEFPPRYHPPVHVLPAAATTRDFDCDLDIGAYERPLASPATWGLGWSAAASLSWLPVNGAIGYDVVRGDLSVLRASSGDFSQSIAACLANDGIEPGLSEPAVPAPGEGFFYLTRSSPGGTFESACTSQLEPRDASIEASPFACP